MLHEWQQKRIADSFSFHLWITHTNITAFAFPASLDVKSPICCFRRFSEEANPDGDLWVEPSEGRRLTRVHQSSFTCFITQSCVKTNFDISLCWKMAGSAVKLSRSVDTDHASLWLLTVFMIIVRSRLTHVFHASEALHVRISILVSVSRAEMRWATACCSAVTMPAFVCIIYPPADRSRERHNHSNQSRGLYTYAHCEEKHGLDLDGGAWCWRSLPIHVANLTFFRNEELLSSGRAPRTVFSHAKHIRLLPPDMSRLSQKYMWFQPQSVGLTAKSGHTS